MQLDCASHSNIGGRSENEDTTLLKQTEGFTLAAVAVALNAVGFFKHYGAACGIPLRTRFAEIRVEFFQRIAGGCFHLRRRRRRHLRVGCGEPLLIGAELLGERRRGAGERLPAPFIQQRQRNAGGFFARIEPGNRW